MEQIFLTKQRIQDILTDDPLFQVIKETPTEQQFISEPYLSTLIEKKYYSTPEIASWFEVTDAQLRYYIKPFEEYLFDGQASNPTTATVIRLDYLAVLKLRMILLLKDEYRVKGLKQLLRFNEDGHIIKQTPSTTTDITVPDDVDLKLNAMGQALEQIMKTGLFTMQQDDDTQQMQLTINQDFLEQKIKAIPQETSQELSEIQTITKKLEKENIELKDMIEGMVTSNKQDIAIRIREKHIEQTVLNRLQNEALQRYIEEQKTPFFRKLFRSAEIEIEKENYIAAYIAEHFSKQLTQELLDYHAQFVDPHKAKATS